MAHLRKGERGGATGRPPDRARVEGASFVAVGCFAIIGLLALVAMVSGTPFVFPSLGPTAFLVLFMPGAESARPWHCILGHLVGLLCGYGALVVTGLAHTGPVGEVGVTAARVVAAALAMAATGALLILLRVVHPPAGATTLIVALGIVTRPFHLVVIEVAVVILVVVAAAIRRLAGIRAAQDQAAP